MAERESCAALVKAGHRPSDVCLQQAVRHVCHDLDLFQLAWQSRETHVGYTMWFITARTLMDFFFRYERTRNKDGQYNDDILAADYVPDDRWREQAEILKSSRPNDYDEVRTVTNKLSAHLTYSRLGAEGTSLPPSAAVHEFIFRVAAVWLSQLVPARRAWFGRSLPCGDRAV